MLCGWGVGSIKAGIARLHVNTVLPYLSALKMHLVFEGALQMSRFTLLFTSRRSLTGLKSLNSLLLEHHLRCRCVDTVGECRHGGPREP